MELSKAQQLLNLIRIALPPIKSSAMPEVNDAVNHERLIVLKTVLEVLESYFSKEDKE